MADIYTENPENFHEIASFAETEIEKLKETFYSAERAVFYDACSFQRHAHLPDREMDLVIAYCKSHKAAVFILRGILMELASSGHSLSDSCIRFIKRMASAGVRVVIFREEYVFDILSVCFSANEKINSYLTWAVRTAVSPASTIAETLKADKKLTAAVIEGKNPKRSNLYYRFFTAVRRRKMPGDNLGEELIAVCLHILSHLPGLSDGKLCVITDDKGAAGKIDSVMKKTNPRNRGVGIMLFSTPKLVQHMFREHMALSEDEMVTLLSQGTSGNIVVMGITAYDLEVNSKISMTAEDLARRIMEPNGINIVF